VHSFVCLWFTFMYLDGNLVILTAGKVKVCLVVASQHKYLRLLYVPLCQGLCITAGCCAGKCAAGNKLRW